MHSFWHMTFLDGGRLLVDGGGELQSPTLDLSTTSDVLDVAPQAGGSPYSHYLIAEYGTLTGTFDHVTPGISVDYSTAGKIYITGTPVPEPAAAVIAAAGALLFRRRR